MVWTLINRTTLKARGKVTSAPLAALRAGRTSLALLAEKKSRSGASPSPRWVVPRALLVAVVTAAVGSISAAWACVPMANLVTLRPDSSGPAGSRVVVNGLGFDGTPVEIRWNAPNGPRLGAARGPNFSVEVTIPKTPPGLYTVIAVERQQDGSIGNTGSTVFDVIARGETRPDVGPRTAAGDRPRPDAIPSSQQAWGSRWLAPAAAGTALVLLGALGGVLMTRSRRRST